MAEKKAKKPKKKGEEKKKADEKAAAPEPEEEKTTKKDIKKSNTWLIITILIIAAIAIAFLVYVNYINNRVPDEPVVNPNNYFQWGNYTFIKTGDFWKTEFQRNNLTFELSFYYAPHELTDLEIIYNKNNFGKLIQPGYNIYIVINPTQSDGYLGVAASSLAKGLMGVYNIDATAACVKEHEDCEGYLIIPSCESTPYATIMIRKSHITSITYEDNCLTITGEGQELIRATNKVLLGWYGIIEK
ncbi:MAG: hypothetical protein ABIE94_06000 [archaeon]